MTILKNSTTFFQKIPLKKFYILKYEKSFGYLEFLSESKRDYDLEPCIFYLEFNKVEKNGIFISKMFSYEILKEPIIKGFDIKACSA